MERSVTLLVPLLGEWERERGALVPFAVGETGTIPAGANPVGGVAGTGNGGAASLEAAMFPVTAAA